MRVFVGHVFAWCAYAFAIYLINFNNSYPLSLVRAALIVLLLSLVFYPVLGILYTLFRPTRFAAGIVAIIVYLIILLPGMYYYAVYTLLPAIGVVMPLQHVEFTFGDFFRTYGMAVFRVGAYAGLYYSVDMYFRAERRRSNSEKAILLAKNKLLKAQNEKLAYEMASLGLQLSPHLLNNILFRMHVQLAWVNPEDADRLLVLAEIAHYAAQATVKGGGMVLLQQEVAALHQLQELTGVDVVYRGELAKRGRENHLHRLLIPRLALVTLFENAIKYSAQNAVSPQVCMSLHMSATELKFVCRNRIGRAAQHSLSLGTGLQNLRRRLQFHLGERASLEAGRQGDVFNATLRVCYDETNTWKNRSNNENN